MKTLKLTLKKRWFDMIASGEKKEEYRKIKPWILSRLQGKTYDAVEFSNGYGRNAPKVTVEFLGWVRGPGFGDWGGDPRKLYAVIMLGEILSFDNKKHIGGTPSDAAGCCEGCGYAPCACDEEKSNPERIV